VYWSTETKTKKENPKMNHPNDPLSRAMKMPMKTLLDHVRRNLPKVPNSRWYALLDDELALRPLAAALAAWQSERNEGLCDKDVVAFLTELAPWVPGLTQSWRPPKDEPLAPELWRDPVSNQTPKNPWSKDSINVTEQMWLAENEPQLTAYLKATKDGLSYSFLAKQRQEREDREVLRKLEYDEHTHRRNVFRNGTLTEISDFARQNRRAITEVFKAEANTKVVPIWHPQGGRERNLTQSMKLTRENPALRAVVDRGLQVEKHWAQNDLETARANEAETARLRTAAQKLLAPREVMTP